MSTVMDPLPELTVRTWPLVMRDARVVQAVEAVGPGWRLVVTGELQFARPFGPDPRKDGSAPGHWPIAAPDLARALADCAESIRGRMREELMAWDDLSFGGGDSGREPQGHSAGKEEAQP